MSLFSFNNSFENSFCDDYVTEKFFKVLEYDIVPIVLGSGNYSKMAPQHSYIDARDFDSPEELAKYLFYLDKNETAYAEYFEWKKYFKVNWDHRVFCQLCEALNDVTKPSKTYPDIKSWWVNESHCIPKGSFPWSNKSEMTQSENI
jgi:alpha-1,3-fucosyltransferase